MDPLTLALLVTGGIGVLVLLVALVVGDVGGHLGGPDADGPFSLPAIAAFLGGIGFGGAVASSLLAPGIGGPIGVAVSLAIGLAVAVPLAWFAIRLSGRLMRMRTDQTLTTAAVLGAPGRVVTAIGAGGYGEVRVVVGGHQLKYYARSRTALPVGTPVYVVDTPSDTSVEVVAADPDDPIARPA